MKNTLRKKMLIALLGAFVAICAGFALLLALHASSASAEETAETPTYSETWVINENWGASSSFSVSVPFSLNGLETTFSSFSIDVSNSSFMMKVKEGDSEKYISYCFSQDRYSYFNTLKDISDTPFGSTVDYITWKDGFGKITFYEDTSAEGYSALRTWLEANAVKQTAEEPEPAETYSIIFYDECGVNILYTKSGLVSGTQFDTRTDSALQAAAKKNGYTLKGWTAYSEIDKESKMIVNSIPVSGNCKVCAVYESNTEPTDPDTPESTEYKVVFLVDKLAVYTATVENGKAVNFSDYPELAEKTKRDDYTFKGWQIEGQDKLYTDGIPVQNKTTVLVAVYEKNILGIDSSNKTVSVVISVAVGIVILYFVCKLFGGKRRRR